MVILVLVVWWSKLLLGFMLVFVIPVAVGGMLMPVVHDSAEFCVGVCGPLQPWAALLFVVHVAAECHVEVHVCAASTNHVEINDL